ncbi:hypothetical protein [Streptacidiphilus sp. PAMC 29251]
MFHFLGVVALVLLVFRIVKLSRNDTDGRGCMGAIMLAAATVVLGYWVIVG